MTKKDKGTAVLYGNTLYLPITSDIINDSIYGSVNIQKGDKVEIEIDGSYVRYRKIRNIDENQSKL